MTTEINYAATWWANSLNSSLQNDELCENFRKALFEVLHTRFHTHWYISEPLRGSAYRALSYTDSVLDPVLVLAAQRGAITERSSLLPSSLHDVGTFLEKHLTNTRNIIMFINPGEVKIVNTLTDITIPTTGSAPSVDRLGSTGNVTSDNTPITQTYSGKFLFKSDPSSFSDSLDINNIPPPISLK